MPLVVGVDSSTSACKVEIRDADTGRLVAAGRAPHPPATPPAAEQHPADWWTALRTAAARAGMGTTHRVAAVAVAAQQHGLVVCDATGTPLRAARLWNDTTSAPDAAHLVARLGRAAWARAVGSVPVASFTITKLRWLRRHEPDTFARTERIFLPHDWLTWRLRRGTATDTHTTDRGDASGTGWWSPAEARYRPDLLALVDDTVDLVALLPRVLGPAEAAGEHDGVIVGPGTGDNMAAALGLGLRPGDLALSLGTSGTAFTVSDRPTADPGGTVAGFADATGRFLPLVCTLNATRVTDAVARLVGADPARFDAMALSAPPGAGGVVVVPHFDGERTPDRPDATGTIVGLRSDVTPAQLARAAVEGVVCNLLEGAGHLPEARGRLFLVGGGARSAAYRQVVADLTGRVVETPVDDELVARGAAVQAAAVLCGRPPSEVAEAWGLETTVTEPDPGTDAAAVREAWRAAAGL